MINHVVKTDIGLVRKANEDSAGFSLSEDIKGNGDLFIVCDGMGGHVGGAIASQTAVSSIIEYFKNSFHENPIIALNNAIIFANEQIYARAQAEPELKGMGTTCTVLLKRSNEIFIGHVGDSRIYLFFDGKTHRVTKDHSFVQGLVDQGIISDSDAESHPRKNELLKALGIHPTVEPTVSSSPLKPVNDDLFMLCSDGLCGLVNDKTMSRVLEADTDLEMTAENLINFAKEAGGHDNISVILLKITDSVNGIRVFNDFNPKENHSLTATSITGDFGQISEVDPPATSFLGVLKSKKVLIIASIIVLVGVCALLFFPYGAKKSQFKSDEDIVNKDQLVEKVPKDSDYYVIVQEGETMNSIKESLKKKLDTKFDETCAYYVSHSTKDKKEGTSIFEITNIQPGDTVGIDKKCMQSKKVISDKKNVEAQSSSSKDDISSESNPDINTNSGQTSEVMNQEEIEVEPKAIKSDTIK